MPIVMFDRTSQGELNPTKYQLESYLKSLEREFPENIAKCMYTKESSSTLYVKLLNRYMTDKITTPFYKMEMEMKK